ncbi:MAG: sigma-70 family RNA polymerase sigma factor [Planctomycetota bacterium]
MVNDSSTNLSLLARIRERPNDPANWDEFVERYGKMLKRWCRSWGLQNADAEDVTQNVMLALARQMQTFEYRDGGRFRSWLKTIAYRAWCQFLDSRRKTGVAGTSAVDDILQSVEAREDFLAQLDLECERNMLEDAMQLVEQRVQPTTWEAFRRTALDRQSAAEAGASLKMSVMAVYRAKSRVQAMIQEEVEALDSPLD